jgi:hypothetical protein
MGRRSRTWVLVSKLTALLSLQVAIAFGAIVYDNGGPSTDNGFSILEDNSAIDDFTIPSGATITSVGFYFQNYNGITGWGQDISYAIRMDNNNQPGAVLASGSGIDVTAVDSGLPWCCGGNAWLVTFFLENPFDAEAGVTYWLELTGASGTDAWWVTTAANGTSKGWTRTGGASPLDVQYHFAFYLEGVEGSTPAVPEPSSMALLGVGCAALLLGRRFCTR